MNTILRTLAAAAMLAASQASAATGDWPQYGFTAAGRRENTQETTLTRETVPHLVQKWSAKIEVNPWSAPAVANGIVYATGIRKLYALDARTGALVWQAKIGLRSASSPAVSDGVVYVGSLTGIDAFDAETGAVRWTVRSGSFGVSTPISVAGGLVYAGIADGRLLAVNARTGKVKWTAYGDSHAFSGHAPSVADGVVCVTGAYGDPMSAFDARTGASLWSNDLLTIFASAPAAYKGTVYASDGTYLWAFDAKTGQTRWASADGDATDSSGIAIAGGHIYVKNWRTYDAATGQLKSTHIGQMMDSGTPAIANGVLYVNGFSGRGILSAYDTHTGKRLWQDQSTSYFGMPTVANGMLYVSKRSTFTAYGLP